MGTFDPEGDGYDYDTAKEAGLGPGDDGHWPSRDPRSGVLLKGRSHPTFQMGVDEDAKLGYKLNKRDDGRYETQQEPVEYSPEDLEDYIQQLPPLAEQPADKSEQGQAKARRNSERFEEDRRNEFYNDLSQPMKEMVVKEKLKRKLLNDLGVDYQSAGPFDDQPTLREQWVDEVDKGWATKKGLKELEHRQNHQLHNGDYWDGNTNLWKDGSTLQPNQPKKI